MKTWQNYPVKKDSNNNYYIAHLLKGHYVSDYHVIPNDPMGVYDYDEIAAFYKRLTGAEMVHNAEGDLVEQKQVVPEHTIDELKARKLAEVAKWTAAKITGGFISECTGEKVLYDTDRDTQSTMTRARANCEGQRFTKEFPNGLGVRGYRVLDGIVSAKKEVFMFSPAQIIKWDEDFAVFLATCKQAGWIKQTQVEAALSKEDLDAIILD